MLRITAIDCPAEVTDQAMVFSARHTALGSAALLLISLAACEANPSPLLSNEGDSSATDSSSGANTEGSENSQSGETDDDFDEASSLADSEDDSSLGDDSTATSVDTDPQDQTESSAGDETFDDSSIPPESEVRYTFGGTWGPCGPTSILSVDSFGHVERSFVDSELPAGEAECPDPVVTVHIIGVEDAVALIELVEADYEAGHEGDDECEGAFVFFNLYRAEQEEVETENLSCTDSMVESQEAMQKLWNLLGEDR
jgi:hypothetical protein